MGLIPAVPELKYLTMRLLAETFAGQQVDTVGFLRPAQPVDGSDLFVRGVKVRSLESGFETYLEDGDVFRGRDQCGWGDPGPSEPGRLDEGGRPHRAERADSLRARAANLSDGALHAILHADVPTLILRSDSAYIIRSIAELSVKIQPYDSAKKALIERMYSEYLDPGLLERMLVSESSRTVKASHRPELTSSE